MHPGLCDSRTCQAGSPSSMRLGGMVTVRGAVSIAYRPAARAQIRIMGGRVRVRMMFAVTLTVTVGVTVAVTKTVTVEVRFRRGEYFLNSHFVVYGRVH